MAAYVVQITQANGPDTVTLDATSSPNALNVTDGSTFASLTVNANTASPLIADPDPTLSADLDLNGNDITGTGNITTTGDITLTGNLTFGDSDKAIFGAGSDLQIYHDGSNSQIREVGAGDLYISADSLRLTNAAVTEFYARGFTNGAFELYHNGNKKLATTATGIDVTGNATFGDSGKAIFGASSDLQIYHDGSHSYIADVGTGNLRIRGTDITLQDADGNGYISMVDGGAGGTVYLKHLGSNVLTTTSTGIDVTGNATFGDSGKAIFGASSDLSIYHDGSNSYIKEAGTGDLKISGNNLWLEDASGNTYFRAVNSSYAKMYHSGSEKLATTSTGIDVTGNATFGDSGKAIFGAGSDLQIYHDGSNSYITDAGTGDLKIRGAAVSIETGGGNLYFKGDANIATLYHTNAAKLATTSTGIDVTGSVTADGGTITGAFLIDVDNEANGALRIAANQTNPDNDFYFAQEIVSTLSGTTATTADREQGGIYMDINSTATGGDTSNEHRAYGMYIDLDSTGDANTVYGVYADATATPAEGTTSNIVGIYGVAEDNGGAGQTTSVYGVRGVARSDNASSDINSLYGGHFLASALSDSGFVGNSYGLYAEIDVASGAGDVLGNSYVVRATLDNNSGVAQTNSTYLFYGDYTGTLPTNAYGVYINSDVPSYFKGNVGIRATSPSEALDVRSGSFNSSVAQFTGASNGRGLLISTFQRASNDDSVDYDAQFGGHHTFSSSGSEKVRIDNTGNVGINTTNPGSKLDVNGSITTDGLTSSDPITVSRNADNMLVFDNTSASDDWTIKVVDTDDSLRFTWGAGDIYNFSSDATLPYSSSVVTRGNGDARYLQLSGGTLTGDTTVNTGLKVGTGANGSANGDELAISKNQANVGISILSADGTGQSRIYFGSQTDTQAAMIRHNEVNDRLFVQANGDLYFQTGGTSTTMTLNTSGDLDVTGALSKGSGSFKIDHPLKPDTHHLVHSFIEGPQADNIYRGRVDLVDGTATLNLDEAGRMTEGTFVALNGNVQCLTTNEDGWTAVRGKVEGNILTIEAQDAACTDTVSWMVIGERHDQHMIDTAWTDADGRVITEPEKPPVEINDTE